MDIDVVDTETIVAIATAKGRGGVGVVRISGPMTTKIAKQILSRPPIKPRKAYYSDFKNQEGRVVDSGIAIFFKAPNSFTGEDVLELQGHGGGVVLDQVLELVLSLGLARIANPGEFSERAFLNNKIDLLQAEAIAQLIDAKTSQAAQAATLSLRGGFSKKIHDVVEQLVNIRLYVEAAIDFPEEEIDFLKDEFILKALNKVSCDINELLKKTKTGVLLAEGTNIVIAGAPNAGKSSLLNKLTGQETAIVTPIAGTTRDKICATIKIDGLIANIIDTAGIRETDDVIELAGIKLAEQALIDADIVLLVVDGGCNNIQNFENKVNDWYHRLLPLIKKQAVILVILNKIDKFNGRAQVVCGKDYKTIWLSAEDGRGIDLLCQEIKDTVGFIEQSETVFIARRRHLEAIIACQQHVLRGREQLSTLGAGELLAEELRLAQFAMAEITGEFTSDDLLGKIFSSFCIGK